MQSQISGDCHLCWGKKGGKIWFWLDFSIPAALLSSDPKVQGSIIPGRCFSDAGAQGWSSLEEGGAEAGQPCSSQDYLRSNPQAPG